MLNFTDCGTHAHAKPWASAPEILSNDLGVKCSKENRRSAIGSEAAGGLFHNPCGKPPAARFALITKDTA